MSRKTPRPLRGFAATRTPRGIIKRAEADLEAGREDTECRRPDRSSRAHCPTPAKTKRETSSS
ncbi:MAG TPA: hypothetical protein VE935_14600 [Burkholderiales bacterium]|nr:hypothetical protein [Burkholderiales bacterium]